MSDSKSKSWESECCRCGGDVKIRLYPGKRACHITCGPCLYPINPHCISCEIVTHCAYALEYLRSIEPGDNKKGCYFEEQLTGDETLYHTLQFVDASQRLAKTIGEKKYLQYLKKTNLGSACLTK
jgi:hypothetical protein